MSSHYSAALVCGGRLYGHRARVYEALDALPGVTVIYHGGCTGADALADDWARERNIPRVVYEPRWDLYGKRAGPERNQRMVDSKPDVVVAFPGGSGTKDLVRRARKAGLRVVEVK